jgi:hypothetical protein
MGQSMRQSIIPLLVFVTLAAALLLCVERRKPAPRPEWALESNPAGHEAVAAQRRSLMLHRLARRIIAERIPLLEAAELFREANGKAGLEALVRAMPGRSLREKLCRQVIHFVVAETEAATAPRVSEALQDELDRRLVAGEFPPEPGMSSELRPAGKNSVGE